MCHARYAGDLDAFLSRLKHYVNLDTPSGGSDGSYAASVGIPVIDGMGAEGEFSHTMDEYVKADTIVQRLQTCIELVSMLMDA